MESLIHPRKLFWILLAAAAVQAAYFFPQLPEEVASRFGTDGEVVHTMSKSGFMMLHLGVIAVVAALFGGVPVEQIPNAFLNLPHKDYWLSPEREAASKRYLQDELFIICNATLLLLAIIFHWVLQANLMEEPRLDPAFTWVPIGLYLAFTLVWTLRLIRRFQTPDGDAARA